MAIQIEDDSTIVLTRKEYEEYEILKRTAEGMSCEEIAAELALSYPTVKWYRKRIKEKFQAKTMAQIVKMAMEQGLL